MRNRGVRSKLLFWGVVRWACGRQTRFRCRWWYYGCFRWTVSSWPWRFLQEPRHSFPVAVSSWADSLCFTYEGDGDSSPIFSDNGIHFPVSESGAVGLWVSLIYHYSVLDSRVGNGAASFDMLELVPTVLVEFSSTRTVEADVTVNGFDADARFSFAQHPTSDLLGWPLLVDHQCEDLLSLLDTELARFTHPPLTFVTLLLGNAVMVMVRPLLRFNSR